MGTCYTSVHGTECNVRLISFIHLFAYVPGWFIDETIPGFSARFPIDNLVDRELRATWYKRLIKLH